MRILKENHPGKEPEKYKYKKHREHITLHIVDSGTNKNFKAPFEDFTNNGKVPMYEGYGPTDPLGSYTGKPIDENDVPVQDVDDL